MLKRNAPSRQGRARSNIRPSSTYVCHNDESTPTANSKRPRMAAATTSTAVAKRGPSKPTRLPRQRKTSPMEARANFSSVGEHSLSACTFRIQDKKTIPSNQAGVEKRSVGTKLPAKDLAQFSQPEPNRGENDGRLEGSQKIRSSMKLKLRSNGADKKSHEASGTVSRTSTANQSVSKVKKNVESKRVTGWVPGGADIGIADESQERRSKNTPIADVPSTIMPPSEVAESAARREKESTEDKISRVDTNYAPAVFAEVTTKDQPRLSPGTPILGPANPISPTGLTSASTSPPLDYTATPSTSSTKARGSPDVADLPPGEELENLPPSPFPGHENVSWACLACDGARHHLTSRSAMEPLRRMHGFKVHRVPNDGDCFFSSVKAALDGSPSLPREGGGGELTVARMREWVADETSKEQLDFYILQAKANPQDRWLDFVRPMDERVPSDDEDLKDGGEDEGEEDESNGVEDESSSQYTPPARPKQSKRRGKEREAAVDGNSSRDEAKRKVSEATESRSEGSGAPDPNGRVNGVVERNNGIERGGVVGWESLKQASEKPSPPGVEKTPTAGPETSRETCPTEMPQAPVGGRRRVGVRRSTRFGRSGVTPSRGDQAGGSEAMVKGGREDDAPGLPFVRSVKELRSFVRLEGSVVGQGGCMWADTFAHHVVSRRLGITILFVDMERDIRAWPYRILAKCTDKEGSEDERFVLLKREPNHFVLIKMEPPGPVGGPQDTESAIGSRNCRSFPKGGLSCFCRSELPDVVQKLWGIDPAPSAATLPAV